MGDYLVPPADDLDELVRAFTSEYVSKWLNTPTDSPHLRHSYTHEQQLLKERELDELINDALTNAERGATSQVERLAAVEATRASVRTYLANSLKQRHNSSEASFLDDFWRVMEEFIVKAKRFDSELKYDDIHQALRNVWIINSIQICMERAVALTPSSFAYSLLYPYTDNYLDDISIPYEAKKEFTCRIGLRLRGEKVEPNNRCERTIFDLIGIIEREYPRTTHPGVLQSLVAIHNAQQLSLSQQDGSRLAYQPDILAMSVEKGGTSVLADGYLANGTLLKKDANLMFGYGVFLQLIDDLQDLPNDLPNKHLTIFTEAADVKPLDAITNRLLDFLTNILDSADQLTLPRTRALKELIERSCVVLILEAVAENRNMFSEAYCEFLERHSPFGFSYMRSIKQKLKRNYARLCTSGVMMRDSVAAHHEIAS